MQKEGRARSRTHRLRTVRGLVLGGLVVMSVAGTVGSPVAAGGAGDQPANTGAAPTTGSQLGPGQGLAPGQTRTSPDGQVVLTMQSDGNLVSYAPVGGGTRVLWASGTDGSPGAQCVMQSDGNLVVYSPAGSALWSSGTAGHPGAELTIQDDGNTVVYAAGGSPLWSSGTALDFVGPDVGPVLPSGRALDSGEFLQSPNGRYRLYESPDGAPELYQQGAEDLWWLMEGAASLAPVAGQPTFFTCALCTRSALPGSFLTLQGDGNVVLYRPGGGGAEWAAGVAGWGGVSLRLQDDGNLVLYGAPDAAGVAPSVWQTGTETFRGTVLGEGVSLRAGQFVLSPDGLFELVVQVDGNVVLYGAARSSALWSSGTKGDVDAFLSMQHDDNLVLYGPATTSAGGPVAPNAGGPEAPDAVLWSSGTGVTNADPDVASATVGAATALPPQTAARSAPLALLSASNLFGQNAPAIATAEAQYEQMWAQDAVALLGHVGP